MFVDQIAVLLRTPFTEVLLLPTPVHVFNRTISKHFFVIWVLKMKTIKLLWGVLGSRWKKTSDTPIATIEIGK